MDSGSVHPCKKTDLVKNCRLQVFDCKLVGLNPNKQRIPENGV